MSNAHHTPGPEVGTEQPFTHLTAMWDLPSFLGEGEGGWAPCLVAGMGPTPRTPDSQACSRLQVAKPLPLPFLVRVCH